MAQEKHTRAYCVNEKRGYRQILYVVLQNSNKKSKFKKQSSLNQSQDNSTATVLKPLGSRVKIVKFPYNEKAKKYDKISKLFLTLLSNFNKTLEISTKFIGLLRIYELYNKKLRFLFEFNSSLNRQTKRPCRILHGLTLL